MDVPGLGYQYIKPDRKLSYAGPLQYELRQEYSFLLFSKAAIALYVIIYSVP